jgi:hypothetical protein
MKTLEEMIRDLPPEAQPQVAGLVRQLAESPKPALKRKLDQRWAGSSEEISRPVHVVAVAADGALEWRGD